MTHHLITLTQPGLFCLKYQGAWLRILIWQEPVKARQAEILTAEEIGQLCGGN